MDNNTIPLNVPPTQRRNYDYVIEKGFDKYIKIIFSLGSYITFQQFYQLFRKYNENLSESYCKLKANSIIKELEKLKFINVESIGKHKYFYLKAPSLAICVGDYSKIPKTNHKNISIKNNKFMTSLMKVEYYIEYNEIISSEWLFKHLKAITRNIIVLTEKHNLEYNLSFLKAIYSSNDYTKIKDTVSKLPEDDLIHIIWVDLYNLYYKLLLQGQTLSQSPLYFKLNVVEKKLKLHYIPEIIIFDYHKSDYYERKMDRLLADLINIKSNTVDGLRKNYLPNQEIGDSRVNIIGYGLKLIGSNEQLLKEKEKIISTYGRDNSNSPFVSVKTSYINLSNYFSYTYRKLDVVEKIDNQIESIVTNKLNEILNSN